MVHCDGYVATDLLFKVALVELNRMKADQLAGWLLLLHKFLCGHGLELKSVLQQQVLLTQAVFRIYAQVDEVLPTTAEQLFWCRRLLNDIKQKIKKIINNTHTTTHKRSVLSTTSRHILSQVSFLALSLLNLPLSTSS